MPQHIGIVGCSAEGAALCYRTICLEGAAHLGEVLWKMGDQEGAQKVWREALVGSPAHPVLTATVKKFAP